ncbi:hypothetical protein Nizo2535_1794 [Lactiplantibacillus plantarum]|nr:hypothetical protein Nizo2535_1794 [Lactiplantibacillus plantarum]KZU82656.1 hypothetical protein Nizo2891_0036 [Lactiplantibacillus plantarum]
MKKIFKDFKIIQIYGLAFFIEKHPNFIKFISAILATMVTSLVCLLLKMLS